MKLVTFETEANHRRTGAVVFDGRVVDLNLAEVLYLRDIKSKLKFDHLADGHVASSMRDLFEGGDRSLDAARQAVAYVEKLGPQTKGPSGETMVFPMSAVKLRVPVQPKKFFHTAGNFLEHLEEAQKIGVPHSDRPRIVFFQNVDAMIGTDEPIIYPEHLTHELDYELELAVVLKKSGKHFDAEQAKDYIGGYVIFNDITARDIQRREMESGVCSFCKGIESFCPLGPWIVTAEEIPDPHALAMELRVNGQVRQRSHSSKMSVKIPEIIANYSAMGYSAGDIISTGTIPGAAAFSDDPKSLYLKCGDVVECQIEHIGILRNPIISWEEAYRTKPPITCAVAPSAPNSG